LIFPGRRKKGVNCYHAGTSMQKEKRDSGSVTKRKRGGDTGKSKPHQRGGALFLKREERLEKR